MVVFLAALVATRCGYADVVEAIADFNDQSPALVPRAYCSVGGRFFLAAQDTDSINSSLTLLESTAFPDDTRVVKRFVGGSVGNSSRRLFDFGCHSAGELAIIPGYFGITALAHGRASATFHNYPSGFSEPVHAFSVRGGAYVVGSAGEVVRFESGGRWRWIQKPYPTPLEKPFFVTPSRLTFKRTKGGGWVEIDFHSLARTLRPEFGVNALRYYQLRHGYLFLTPSTNPEHTTLFEIRVGDGSLSGTAALEGYARRLDIQDKTLAISLSGTAYFTVQENQAWRSDGSLQGTQMLTPDAYQFESFTSVVAARDRVYFKGTRLLSVDSTAGSYQSLAEDMPNEDGMMWVDASGRLVMVDQGVLAIFDAQGRSILHIEDERIEARSAVVLLPQRIIIGTHDGPFRVDRGELEPLAFIDYQVTGSSDSKPLGAVAGASLIYVRTKGEQVVYSLTRDEAKPKRIFTKPVPWGDMNSVGTIANSALFVGSDLTAYLYKSDTERVSQIPFQSLSSQGYLRLASRRGYHVAGGGLVFFADREVWRFDSSNAAVSLITRLPQPFASFDEFVSLGERVLFSESVFDSRTGLTTARWITDGTSAGTKHAEGFAPAHVPYVRGKGAQAKVCYRDRAGNERLLWSNPKPSSLPQSSASACGGEPQIYRVKQSYFVQAPCYGLWEVRATDGSVRKIISERTYWATPHHGDEYLYFAHPTVARLGAISRVAPQGVPELVHVFDETMRVDVDVEPLSSESNLIIWIWSESLGREPFRLIDQGDACPFDARKRVVGLCGCGISDLDQNRNDIVDCRETTEELSSDGNSRPNPLL